jgi:zinc-finger of transposase IS204/IS1001/IS1096/IS1165
MGDERHCESPVPPPPRGVSFRKVIDTRTIEVVAKKDPKEEYCPRCATPSKSTYDTRKVKLRDEPFRTFQVFLVIVKRRGDARVRALRRPEARP